MSKAPIARPNAGELLSFTLRSTGGIQSDLSAPKLTGFIEEADVHEYQRKVLDANSERWIDLLGEETFATVLVPIPLATAEAIVEAHELLQDHLTATPNSIPPDLLQRLPERLRVQFEQLHDALGAPIRSFGAGGCFMKTSSRSPKDAAIRCNLEDRLRVDWQERGLHREDWNARLAIMLQTATNVLQIADSSDTPAARRAVDLLLVSDRIFEDMTLALEHKDLFCENVVLRKWEPLDVSLEFRGFVSNLQLCAVSQYNHLVWYPHVAANEALLFSRIQRYFDDTIRPLLEKETTLHSCVVDFAFVVAHGDEAGAGVVEPGAAVTAAEIETARLRVIEVNPLLDSTDGCLFSWTADRKEMLGPVEQTEGAEKESGFSFVGRVVQRAMGQGVTSALNIGWREILVAYEA